MSKGSWGGMRVDKKTNKLCLGSFNFIKGIAICIIVLGHIAVDFDVSRLTWFYPLFAVLNFLKTPFMPLFFIISGYGFAPNSVKNTFKRMVKSLIVPYLVVALLFSLGRPLGECFQTQKWDQFIDKMLSVALAFLVGVPIPGKILLGYKLSHCAIVWFLLALFWAYNTLNLILKVRRIGLQVALVLGCAALGYGLFQLDFTYYCIPHGLIATSYFYVGYLLKKYKLIEKGLPRKWMYCLWAAVAALYASWGYYDLCYGEFRVFIIDYAGVAVLALLILVIGIYLGRFEWKLFNAVNNIGIYSYWVICIHAIEQKCIPWKMLIRATENCPNIGFILTLLIKVIIITSVCKLLKLLAKMKYRKRKNTYVGKYLRPNHDRSIFGR